MTTTATCPSWCTATHNEDFGLHLEDETVFPTHTGLMSTGRYNHRGRDGVYVGPYEMDIADAVALGRYLTALDEGMGSFPETETAR